MANQSQPRPRFRFGPMIRPIQPAGPPPFPAPAPAPQPPLLAPLSRPSMIRPPFRPPVAAPPQLAQGAAAPPRLLTRIADASTGTRKSPPRSPATQNSPHASPITRRSPPSASPAPRKSPLPATKRLPETLPESPNIKPAPRSPPSFSLPPSQLRSEGAYEREIPTIAEQKTVKPRSFPKPHRDIPKNSSAGINVKSKERETKRGSNPEDIGMRVITISGENRGAVMELGSSTLHHLRSNGESSQGNSSRNEGRSDHNAKAIPSQSMHAFMNNNVQGINSSVVFNSTLSFHDPGIHFRLSRKPDNDHLKDHANEQNLFSD